MSESKSEGMLLAQLFHEIGYVATVAKENVISLLQSVYGNRNVIESDIAVLLALMVRTHTGLSVDEGKSMGLVKVYKDASSWDIQILIETLIELYPTIDWDEVFVALDHPGFEIMDARGFEMMVRVFSIAKKDILNFPIHLLWSKWNNPKGQFSLLRFLANAPVEVFPLMSFPVKRVVLDSQSNTVPSGRSLPAAHLVSPWNCQNLIDTLLMLAEGNMLPAVRQLIMELPARIYPELIIIGLAQSTTMGWTKFREEMFTSLFHSFLVNHSNPLFVISRLWSIDLRLVMDAMITVYSQDNTKLSRLLDMVHELKALNTVLEWNIYPFVIDFASLASRREYLNLEKWLQDRIQKQGSDFVQACIRFLHDRIVISSSSNDSQLGHAQKSVGLAPEAFATLVKQVLAYGGSLNSESKKRLHEILEITPKTNAFPEDVEKEANSYFERLFNETLDVTEVIVSLQTFKNSSNKRDRQVWDCVVYSLFEEYRYFLRYPEKELTITGNLFGTLLARDMFEGAQRTTALRMLMESLGKPMNQKLFRCFAVQAILQLKSKLAVYPEICEMLLESAALREYRLDLVALAENALHVTSSEHRTEVTDSDERKHLVRVGSMGTSTRDYSQYPVDGVFLCLRNVHLRADEESSEKPPDAETEEKILFIFNNLTSSNLVSKAKELIELLGDHHIRWFSRYLVKKRVYIESNLQKIYAQLVDTIGSSPLKAEILTQTYACCKTFLSSPTVIQAASTTERTWLKNLGSWLGLLTLARNKPILHRYLPLKELLIEGFDRNRSLLTVPFACKILEQAGDSKIFGPSNAWMSAILRILLELYILTTRQTKGLAIIFEIESLWNKLGLTYRDERLHYIVGNESRSMESSTILRERSSQDLRGIEVPSPAVQPYVTAVRAGTSSVAITAAGHSYPDRNVATTIKETPSVAYPTTVGTSALTAVFSQQPVLRRLVQLVIEQGVREMGTAIRDKVTIITRFVTQALIMKDFAVESNEDEMRKAAHHLTRFLAENLAIVNCRESLRPLIVSSLRFYLEQHQMPGLADDMIQLILLECFESTSTIIEGETLSASLADIDRQLSEAYMLRKRHRERTGQPYYDVSNFALAPDLPELLLPKPGGLSTKHYNLYRGFSGILKRRDIDRTAAMMGELSFHMPSSIVSPRPAASIPSLAEHLPRDSISAMLPAQLLQQAWDVISKVLLEVDRMAYTQDGTFSSMQSNPEFVALVRQLTTLLASIATRDDTVRALGIRLVQNMYVTSSNIGREVRAFCLEKMCESSKRFHEELVSYVMGSNDESRFNVEVMLLLARARILALPELDHYFLRLLEMGRPTFVCFVIHAMIVFLFSEGRMSNQVDFQRTYDLLNRLLSAGRLPKR